MNINVKLLILVMCIAIIALAIWGGTAIMNISKNTHERQNLNIVTEEKITDSYEENIDNYIQNN